ncbi:MAG: DUF1177 domain-containing protein [Thermoprotei archaeon]|nr:DUF1177 domain-containing protein [Thermoprotei archaeon]
MLKYILDVIKILDKPEVTENELRELLQRSNRVTLYFKEIKGDKGSTLFIKGVVKGKGKGPTLGVIGRLGGVGARPELLGLVSDADGAIVALSVLYKLAEMAEYGDVLKGDVIVTTHVTTHAPVKPYKPVPMMDSPVDIFKLLKEEVDEGMQAILSIDSTKANKVINYTGFAITHVIKEGWILKVSDEILDIYTRVTGEPPVIVPLTMQDVLPFSTKIYHINSIIQPWIYTTAPVIGVATTTRMPVPGSATGVTNVFALDQAARFVLEVAKDFTAERIKFYDEKDWETIIKVHGNIREIMRKGAPL